MGDPPVEPHTRPCFMGKAPDHESNMSQAGYHHIPLSINLARWVSARRITCLNGLIMSFLQRDSLLRPVQMLMSFRRSG